jgi:hypothetical protein
MMAPIEHFGVDVDAQYPETLGLTLPIPPPCQSGRVGDDDDDDEEESDSDWYETDSDDDDESLSDGDIGTIEADHVDKNPPKKPEEDYDKDDPPMAVGTMYSSMDSFKLALATQATKNEFQYTIVKADKSRYRVHCSSKDEGCKWRLLASRVKNMDLVEVVVVLYLHGSFLCIALISFSN